MHRCMQVPSSLPWGCREGAVGTAWCCPEVLLGSGELTQGITEPLKLEETSQIPKSKPALTTSLSATSPLFLNTSGDSDSPTSLCRASLLVQGFS